MFFRSKIKSNSRNNSNKQSAKGGAIKNSTIEVNASGNDSTQAVILAEVLKLGEAVSHIKKKQNNMQIAFCHYVDNNGVKPEVKTEVKRILEINT